MSTPLARVNCIRNIASVSSFLFLNQILKVEAWIQFHHCSDRWRFHDWHSDCDFFARIRRNLFSQDNGGESGEPLTSSSTDATLAPWFSFLEEDLVEYDNMGLDEDDNDEYCEVLDEYGLAAYETFCEETDDAGGPTFRWIRVEKQEDIEVQSLKTKQDVSKKIREAKAFQSQNGNADLYPRRWVSSSESEHHDWGTNGKGVNSETVNGRGSCIEKVNGFGESKHSFSVLQFNALAEGLSAGPHSLAPFVVDPNDIRGQREKNSYGGFTDIPFPSASLDFMVRRWRVLEVLAGGGLTSFGTNEGFEHIPFDIIAMEEVDRYRGFFFPILKQIYGYDGIFAPKKRSPSVRMGWYSDGCALFWKQEKFELISKKRLEYKVGNQVMLLATLRHLPSKKPLLVAVTHLKAQKSEANEKVRVAQVDQLLQEIDKEILDIQQRLCLGKDKQIPLLIAGDFNAEPPDGVSESAVGRVLRGDTSMVNFQSAYPLTQSSFYTTWKKRGPKTHKRVVDYIFHSGMECDATLSIPREDELEVTKLPGLRYPSDHLAIGATFHLPE